MLLILIHVYLACIESEGHTLCDENDAAEPSNEYTKWDCARRCYDTPTCVAWLFKEAATPHTCWLKTSTDCSQPESGSVWGTRECGNHVPGTIK